MKAKFQDTSSISCVRIKRPTTQIPLSSPIHESSKFNINKKPVKSNSQNLYFTGFLYHPTNPFKIEEVLKLTDKHLGSSARNLFNHLKDSELTSKLITIDKHAKEITFNQKSIPHLLFDGLVYPVKVLPFDIANGIISGLRKIGPLKKWAQKVYESPTFKNIRQRSKIEAETNALRGLFEEVVKLKGKSNDEISKELFIRSVEMFDPKTGKYDTKHERSLNRIVSGFIPAIFLANDAYNLSRMCNDNPSEANAEKKIRFRQETSRVLAQAYITLITMGAITKHINKSKFAVMANVGITTLFTETISRLSAGKQISRISPEKAKELNAKASGNNQKNTDKSSPDETYKNVFFRSTGKRKSLAVFSGQEVEQADATTPPTLSFVKKESADKNTKAKAPLLSFSTLFKAVAGLVVAGFALKGLRKSKAIDTFIKKSFEPFSNFYKKITTTENKISREDFKKILKRLDPKSLEQYGKNEVHFHELATKYIELEEKNKAHHIKNQIEQLLTVKPSQLQNKLKALEGLNGEARDAALKELSKTSNTAVAEMSEVLRSLKPKELKTIAQEYKTIIDSLQKQMNTPIVKEMIKQLATDSKGAETLLNNNLQDLAASAQKIINNHSDIVYLGKKDKKYIKPLVDFLIGPFKFTWNVLEGPYYWANKLINALRGQSPKEVKKAVTELDAFRKSIDNIGKEALRSDIDEKAFKSYVSDNMMRAFNSDNVSKISNSDLANLAKTAVLVATLPFLMADNYNIVMMKSNGEDKEGAELKYKERLVQEASRFFYSTLMISLFNNTFQSQYHNSLLGMSWITAACVTISEVLNRKSVGVPVGKYSRDEIMEMEKKKEDASSFLKGYYQFMARLTGKKSLAEMQAAKTTIKTQTNGRRKKHNTY